MADNNKLLQSPYNPKYPQEILIKGINECMDFAVAASDTVT